MNRSLARTALLAVVSLLLPLSSQGQIFRAYLASYGNDANPCTVASPCRLLPAALNAVAPNGEIWMLDSANYNATTVNIAKSANILAIPGQVGSIVAVGNAPAITIAPGMTVSLLNVAIVNNASNPGTDGIQMTSGTLTIDDSLIAGVGTGLDMNGTGIASVNNVNFRGVNDGVRARNGGQIGVSRSKFSNNSGFCAWADASVASTTSTVLVNESSFMNCYGGAIAFSTVAGAAARMMVANSSFANGFYGVATQSNAGGPAVLSLTNSTVFSHTTGVLQNGAGAVLETQGNTFSRGSNTNSTGSLTAIGGI